MGRTSKKAIMVIMTGLFLPFVIGVVIVYLLHRFLVQDVEQGYNVECGFLWAAIFAVTGFQAVNRILSNLKLLNSEIGRLARPIALISDFGSWILIVMLIPFCANPMTAPFVIFATMGCVVVLHDGDYAVTMVAILLMNSIVPPTIAIIYKRNNLFAKYSSRTIQDFKPEEELRILVCAHSYPDVPGTLKLLDVSHSSRHDSMTVFTLHLVELANQSSPMLIVHDSHASRFENPASCLRSHDSAEADRIVTAYTEFENATPNVAIQSFTIVSPFRTVSRDICSLAKDKVVAFIILPYHRLDPSSFRNINHKVLHNAPCSVGIFIDRGLESAKIREIAMLFFGGADDCEALAYAWRMATKPGVSLTVVRLLETEYVEYSSKQNQQDADYIHDFRLQTADEELIIYEEKVIQCGEELMMALKEMENRFELFVVGKREGLDSPIMTELFHMVDCPDLGIVGNLLTMSDSAATSSVLVVQQFIYRNTRRTLVFQKGMSRLERRKVNVESIPFL
ncbi:hypothetical protein V6N13_032724 [Hibiscus sabdariffa]